MQLWSAKTAAVGILPVVFAATGADCTALQPRHEDVRWGAYAASTSTIDDEVWLMSRNSASPSQKNVTQSDDIFVVSGSEVYKPTVSPDETPMLQGKSGIKTVEFAVDIGSSRAADAIEFLQLLDAIEWRPDIWGDEGEIVFEWISDTKHAVVSFEGDGSIGYTVMRDGAFVAGEVVDAPSSILPPDLREYLSAA